jgi:putative holliday junction resolvase
MPDIQEADFALGFDFGMRRIGIAVGTRESLTARPLVCLPAKNGVPDWSKILKLISEWEVQALVIGSPLNMDGSTQNTTFAAKRFANKLASKCRLPAYLVDERLTSVEARRTIKEEGLPFDVDSYSAKLILEQWLRSDEVTWVRSN